MLFFKWVSQHIELICIKIPFILMKELWLIATWCYEREASFSDGANTVIHPVRLMLLDTVRVPTGMAVTGKNQESQNQTMCWVTYFIQIFWDSSGNPQVKCRLWTLSNQYNGSSIFLLINLPKILFSPKIFKKCDVQDCLKWKKQAYLKKRNK